MTVGTNYEFPTDFIWGVATAAPQIEGAGAEDGKGESIWDRFALTPGRIDGGDDLSVACDHYHRYADDFRLMKELGVRNYRFSLAWPRIFPGGRGAPNEKGLAFYDRLIDSMLEHSITPWATLFHWDMPQPLEDEGGWRSRSTVEAFGIYAEAVVKRYRDRVKNWMTLNELPSFIGHGYGNGHHAPGARESRKGLAQCYHNALLAHGLGVRAVRQHGGAGAQVGLVHNPATPVPVTETPADIAAARAQYALVTSRVMAPVLTGSYPAQWLEYMGADAPDIAPGDMELIGAPTDFFGLNLYGGSFCRAKADGSPELVPLPADYPRGGLQWLNITPQVMYWAVRHAVEQYNVKQIYITENGVCELDTPEPSGEVLDLGRREFYRNALISLHRASAQGFPVKGFFAWSFMDNFEWAEGYGKRFGLVHVDYATQKRTPKLSAQWYSRVMAENRVL